MKICGYARVSSREQSEGKSIDNQIALLKKAGCEEIFFDIESAFKRKDRPNFNKLMNLVRMGAVRTVIVCTLDRLSRNEATTFIAFDDFEANHCRLISLEENFDLSTPEGRMMAGFITIQSRSYSASLSKKVSRGHKAHRDRQEAYFKVFGYEVIDRKYYLNPIPFLCLLDGQKQLSKVDIAKDIVSLFKQAKSLSKTVKAINAKYGLSSFCDGMGKGNRQPRDRFGFSYTGLQSWLTNPVLRGHTSYKRRGKQHIGNKLAWDIRHDTHPDQRIISDLEYREIEEILEWNRKHHGFNKSSDAIHLFSGLVVCGECGRSHRVTSSVQRDGSKKYYYQCQNYTMGGCSQRAMIRDTAIEEAVIPKLIESAQSLAAIAATPPRHIEHPKLRELRMTLANLESLPSNVAIADAISSVRLQIKNLEHSSEQIEVIDIKLRSLLLTAFADADFFATLEPETKKQIFRDLLNRIIVRDRRVVEIELKI